MSDCYICQDPADHVDAEHPGGQPCPSGITRVQMDWLVDHHPIFEAQRSVARAFAYMEASVPRDPETVAKAHDWRDEDMGG